MNDIYTKILINQNDHNDEMLNYIHSTETSDLISMDNSNFIKNKIEIYSNNCIIENTNKSKFIKEKKYKIFDDITFITINKNNEIELVINIPKTDDILYINKIRFSKINNFIKNIFITLDDKIIINNNDIFPKRLYFYNNSDEKYELNKKYINCCNGVVNINIILNNNAINNIINSYIYILFTHITFKKKIKYLTV
jgi:hypothetical protein